jgi:CCR4-NOT transcription complex subunit 4
VQKNLVFVVGLPPRLADAEILKKHEYFGKYGKIHKVVINPSTTYAGVQGPSASAYVTYVHNNDALRAIQSVNNITIDGRSIKTSLGTTKYCSHFMKNQSCPKPDCMYLHELGDSEASFTKEEMHQGKHQEYEKRLHEALIAQMQTQPGQPIPTGNPTSNPSPTNISPANSTNGNSNSSISSSNASTNGNGTSSQSSGKTGDERGGDSEKNDAWPSLSTSPVNSEKNSGKTNGKIANNKENARSEANRKHEKVKGDKQKGKSKHQNQKSTQKTQHHEINSRNIDDELVETDSDDTPSISSTTDSGTISESDSGKSSPPSSFPDPVQHHNIINVTASQSLSKTSATASDVSKQDKSVISSSIIETSDITSLYHKDSKDSLADTSGKMSQIYIICIFLNTHNIFFL